MSELTEKHCKACEGGVKPLTRQEAEHLLKKLNGWELSPDNLEIECTFAFKNYYHTMAFVNALAYVSNIENHHPDLEVSYNRCLVRYTTHAIGGLSENDFICAAKADALIDMYRKER
jgi:4a-hydroxytetrahydrobiopterin dehydratase